MLSELFCPIHVGDGKLKITTLFVEATDTIWSAVVCPLENK